MTLRERLLPFCLLLFFVLLLVSCGYELAQAKESHAPYLILRQAFVFDYAEQLPYTPLREMCWHDVSGYCDVPLTDAYVLYTLVDGNERVINGQVIHEQVSYVMHSNEGCFVWKMLPELGSDGQPHVESAYWIECDHETS